MNTVFQQEVIRYNNLIVVIKQSLQNLIKGVDGFVVMTQELD